MPEALKKTGYSMPKDYPYFRRVRNRVIMTILGVSFLPLILLGVGMYFYAASELKQKTMESLLTEAVNHKKAIDQFLVERTMDLRLLSKNLGLPALIRQGGIEEVFISLHGELPCFSDLGVIDDQGRHLAYAGPYKLISRNYKDTKWFKAVSNSNTYISDVFPGFRNIPHFIIAVKQTQGDRFWIIRATVDTSYFNRIVRKVTSKMKGDAYLVNKSGVYQTTPPDEAGSLMGPSGLNVPGLFEGVKMDEGRDMVRMMTWLENVPWLCVVQIDRDSIFKSLHKVRDIGVYVFMAGGVLILVVVFLTTNGLVSHLEFKRRSIHSLDRQLRHAGRMASSMRLFYGFFREINDILANIDVTASLASDLTHKGDKAGLEECTAQIRSEVSRSRSLIHKLLEFTHPSSGPVIVDVNVNEMLDELLEFLDSEFRFNDTLVVRDYQDPLPMIRSDSFQLRQVFENLLFNAMTAIEKHGEITLKTSANGKYLRVSVCDDGPGIPKENMERIFEPLFTTWPENPGLGLSICLSILERLGGDIRVESEPGRGATFIVELPLQFRPYGL